MVNILSTINLRDPVNVGTTRVIRVWPTSENVRLYMKHPSKRIRFLSTIYQSVEWPLDTFTNRRIADGSVRTTPPPGADT